MNDNPILELYGIPVHSSQERDWVAISTKARCPFLDDRCRKTRKSNPTETIGTCSISHSQKNLIICPYRMLEKYQVFDHCIPLLQSAAEDSIHLVSEVQVPGGNIDYCLVAVRHNKIVDFIGIELQSVDTTGTLWPHRQNLLHQADWVSNSVGSFGINWKMTAKTILIQLLHKTRTFEELNKKLVIVFQDHLFDYIRRAFQFDELSEAGDEHTLHIHVYTFQRIGELYTLQITRRYGLTSAYIASSLGLRRDSNAELDALIHRLARKVSPNNRLR